MESIFVPYSVLFPLSYFFALHSCHEYICPMAHLLITVVHMLEAPWWVLQYILVAAYQYLSNLNLHE